VEPLPVVKDFDPLADGGAGLGARGEGAPVEVNLHELLRIAQTEFKSVKTMDECELKSGWPQLRAALGRAFSKWHDKFNHFTNHPKAPPLWLQRFTKNHGVQIFHR